MNVINNYASIKSNPEIFFSELGCGSQNTVGGMKDEDAA